jgi:hypothetical protein
MMSPTVRYSKPRTIGLVWLAAVGGVASGA